MARKAIGMIGGAWVLAGLLAGCAPVGGEPVPSVAAPAAAPETPNPMAQLPDNLDILFWTEAQRDIGFRLLDTRVPVATVRAGGTPLPLPVGADIAPRWQADGRDWTVADYMADQRAAGLIVISNRRIRLERYALGLTPQDRWTSFSVAKSFTSTLVGAAISDGHIGSLDDEVTRYIPELTGSGYDGVTIAQLMSMQSGVRWNEDYADPASDVARFNAQQPEAGLDPVTAYMRRLPREAEPGTRWHYNTGETNLIGVLVERATRRSLADYLSEKLWRPLGMEADATWLRNSGGQEIAGCCLGVRLRDYARFGQFVLDGGRAGGRQVVPEGWFAVAGAKHADIGAPGRGYGYQWWTYDDGSFAAQGIFGQGIFIDPAQRLVIVQVGNWPVASDRALGARRLAFYRAVRDYLAAER